MDRRRIRTKIKNDKWPVRFKIKLKWNNKDIIRVNFTILKCLQGKSFKLMIR